MKRRERNRKEEEAAGCPPRSRVPHGDAPGGPSGRAHRAAAACRPTPGRSERPSPRRPALAPGRCFRAGNCRRNLRWDTRPQVRRAAVPAGEPLPYEPPPGRAPGYGARSPSAPVPLPRYRRGALGPLNRTTSPPKSPSLVEGVGSPPPEAVARSPRRPHVACRGPRHAAAHAPVPRPPTDRRRGRCRPLPRPAPAPVGLSP